MKRPPDFVIGDPANPYMLRWHIVRSQEWPSIYRHSILRNDDDRALHDHRGWNISIVLSGIYDEVVPDWSIAKTPFERIADLPVKRIRRGPGSIVFRRAASPHRLEVVCGPVETLFITGPTTRDWGFHCPLGWKHWKLFTDPNNPGETGPGCGA